MKMRLSCRSSETGESCRHGMDNDWRFMLCVCLGGGGGGGTNTDTYYEP